LTVTRIYEPEVPRYLQAHVRSGDLAVDVGANIGYFTLLFARLVGPEGRVIAFEPNADNVRLLRQNVDANAYTNVEIHSQAVADSSGRSFLYLSPDNPGDHRLVKSDSRSAVPVNVVALDDALPELCGKLDWLKVDVQGAELAALRGMRSLIDSSAKLTIVLEFAPRAMDEFGTQPEQLLGLLFESGFEAFAPQWDGTVRKCSVDDLMRRAHSDDRTYTNLIFARSGSWN
jgi:FkbM family methyltransferase